MATKNRLFVLGLVGALALTITGTAANSAGDSVTVVTFGGAFEEALSQLDDKFTAETGIKVVHAEWSGEMAKVRAMVETGQYSWDVLATIGPSTYSGCDEGILEPIDLQKVGGASNFSEAGRHKCGAGADVVGWVWVYNNELFPGERPQTWADFWNVEKFPGKRGLRRDPQGTLEAALFAAGVPGEEIYKRLATAEGRKLAFEKLDEIRDNVVWWTTGAQSMQLLHDKEVSMTSAWNGRAYAAIRSEKKNYTIVWDGQLLEVSYYTIPARNPNLDAALKYIEYMSRPKNAAHMVNKMSYGSSIPRAADYVDPEIAPFLPTTPKNQFNSITLDPAFWSENQEALTAEFEAWLAK